ASVLLARLLGRLADSVGRALSATGRARPGPVPARPTHPQGSTLPPVCIVALGYPERGPPRFSVL
ncbi:MAG: hypothetical protein M3M94_00495, partial [Actinomycetota bacterium]|nr:hypothetical protein [Actinomycetota bacterium]